MSRRALGLLLALSGLAVCAGVAWWWLQPAAPIVVPARPASSEPPKSSLLQIEPPRNSPVWRFLDPSATEDAPALAGAADQLPDSLSHGEQNALLDFLRDGLPALSPYSNPTPAAASSPMSQQRPLLSQSQYVFVANQLMDALIRQWSPSPSLTAGLIEIWEQAGLDPTLRDYALQHLATWFGPPLQRQSSAETDPSEQRRILEVLFAAADATNGHSAGTALLSLHHIALDASRVPAPRPHLTDSPAPSVPPQVDLAKLQAATLSLAEGSSVPEPVRATALQVAAQRGWKAVLPEARRLMASQSQSQSLRASAIAAVGQLGDLATDGSQLTGLLSSTDNRLLASSEAALKRLRNSSR